MLMSTFSYSRFSQDVAHVVIFFSDVIPKGYMTFEQEGGGEPEPQPQKLSFRDVTSPINPQDYTLDSSGGKGNHYTPMQYTLIFIAVR